MKKLILIVFAVISMKSNSQVAGISISPNLTITEIYPHAGFGYSSGIFYEHSLTDKIALSSGAQFSTFRAANRWLGCADCPTCSCPDRLDHRFNLIEFPLDLYFYKKITPKWNIYFTAGYSFAVIQAKEEIFYIKKNKYKFPITHLHGIHNALGIAKFGFGTGREILPGVSLYMGLLFKYAGIYDREYGKFINSNLWIRLGYRLYKKP